MPGASQSVEKSLMHSATVRDTRKRAPGSGRVTGKPEVIRSSRKVGFSATTVEHAENPVFLKVRRQGMGMGKGLLPLPTFM